MAFSFNFLQRIPSTTDLNKLSHPVAGNAAGNGITLWTFNATATGANNSHTQVAASGYFNDAVGYLSQGDVIFAYCNDGNNITVNIGSATGVTPITTHVF